jgi:hypothetical protein
MPDVSVKKFGRVRTMLTGKSFKRQETFKMHNLAAIGGRSFRRSSSTKDDEGGHVMPTEEDNQFANRVRIFKF